MSRHKKFSSVGNILDPTELYKTKRKVNKIIVHCTATSSNTNNVDGEMVDGWHRDRWGESSGIGYHYLVKRDGTLEKGRWVDFIGSHSKGNNTGTIGVAYAGGVKSVNGKRLIPDFNNLTRLQEKTLLTTISTLSEMYAVDVKQVLGHNELPNVNKDCPCLTMSKFRGKVDEISRG